MKALIKELIMQIIKFLRNLKLWIDIKMAPKSAILSYEIYKKKDVNTCLLFCHYHKSGIIYPQIKKLCLFFQELGIDVLFLSPCLNSESKEWVSKNLFGLVIRKNIGRDFGAWKDGISFMQLNKLYDSCEELYLINDSVHCISANLNEVYFKENFIQDKRSDCIGITESFQIAYHLQSYCLKLNAKVIRSSEFQSFWGKFPLVNSRSYIIEQGEIRLSQILIKAGFSCKALYSFEFILSPDNLKGVFTMLNELPVYTNNSITCKKITEYMLDEIYHTYITQVNPTHRYWLLLLNLKCPFIKRDLITSNPEALFSFKLWTHFVRYIVKDGEQEVKLILDCLRTT